MDLVITGPRECEAGQVIPGVLAYLKSNIDQLRIIQGGARGVDRHVRSACELAGIECITEHAWWAGPCDKAWCPPNHRRARGRSGTYCPAAGLRRNQRMLDKYRPLIVLAFLDRDEPTPGTRDMIERSQEFGAVVVIVDVRRSLREAVVEMAKVLTSVE